jgi:hypothetical protein
MPFEAIKDNTPSERVYEDRAMDAYARLEERQGHKSTSPTEDFFRPYLSEDRRIPLINMLLRG